MNNANKKDGSGDGKPKSFKAIRPTILPIKPPKG